MNLRGFAGQASDTKREHVQVAVIRWGRIPATRNYPRSRSFGGFCQPEDFLDVQRLGIHVSLAISREARGEAALQIGELASGLGVGPEIVAKSNIVSPERTVCFNQMQVVRPRLAPAKVLPPRHAAFAAVLITGSVERGNAALDRCAAGHARGYVENRLGAHTRDRGTADVFESHRQRATMVAYSLLFGGEERRPLSVVLDEPDDARLEAERVSHRFEIAGRRTARESR